MNYLGLQGGEVSEINDVYRAGHNMKLSPSRCTMVRGGGVRTATKGAARHVCAHAAW